MEIKLNRKARRRIKHLTGQIESTRARCKLIQMAQRKRSWISAEGETDKGVDFAVYVTPEGLRYGEREPDGFCNIKAYGPDGQLLYGWGGDDLELLQEVQQHLQPNTPA